MITARNSPTLRLAVIDRYWSERPKPKDIPAWAEAIAAEYDTTDKQVRRIIAQEEEDGIRRIKGEIQNSAQQVADVVGGTMAEALHTMTAALEASDVRIVKDSRGNVQKNEDGSLMTIEKPNWAIRLKAAELLYKVHASFAPEVTEINVRGAVIHYTDTELRRELQLATSRLLQLSQGPSGNGRGTVQGEAPDVGSDGATCIEGSLVLDDGMYGDDGRAGSGEPVQAVP